MENQQFTLKNVSGYFSELEIHREKIFQHSIPEIPKFMRDVQPKAFEPGLVSLGPHHHGKPHLCSMDLAKLELFYQFHRTRGLDVKTVAEGVMSLLEELRESYKMISIWNYESNERMEKSLGDFIIKDKSQHGIEKFLVPMMVDGCFVIEFLDNCPHWLWNMRFQIKRDMMMLENQLPMKLLDKLCSMANMDPIGLEKIQFHFSHQSQFIPKGAETRQYLHILDMYRSVLLYPESDSVDDSTPFVIKFDKESQIIWHATQLRESGINFEISDTESFTNVSFEGSTLRLPCMLLETGTESALLNVMAFEKLHIGTDNQVTSFIAFMDNLIDEDRDVALLASNGIVANALGDDRAAANLFNLLAKLGPTTNNTHYAHVNRLVNKHCDTPWNEWSASLKHIYFQSPWTIISVLAAIFAFAILILQAIYQILDYYGVSP